MAELFSDSKLPDASRGLHSRISTAVLGALPALSLGAGLAVTPAWAVESGSVQAHTTYNIAAGELGPALLRFAGQAGVNLSIDMNATRGLKTQGLSGQHSVNSGFEQLLAGTGLRIRKVGEGNYTLDTNVAPVKATTATPVMTADTAPVTELSAINVIARTQSDLMSPTRQIAVIEREQLDTLRAGSDSVATVLSKVLPGMADSSHTITDYGQTLRGRNMLILVDGIPLNTNRDSSRNLANINPADIEEIEVLRGSSAIYGSGAAGGIVSIRTRQFDGEPRAETTVSATTPLSRLRAAGLGGGVQHYFSGGNDKIDYSLSLGASHTGGSYDARGARLAPEPSQGDLFDSNVYNISGKVGLKIDEKQRLQLSLSHYDAKQDTDYASDPSVARQAAGSTAARSIRGLELDEQNRIRNTLVSLDYQNRDIAGSTLAAQIYYRDFFTRFAPFDARAVSVRGANVDQVTQKTSVFGGRLTVRTPLTADKNTQLTWGADFNEERSEMPLDVFDPNEYDRSGGLHFRKIGSLTYMPPITTRSIGAFAQLEHRFNEHWAVQGGARYDRASVYFDDFTPLSQSRVANPGQVSGGTVHYGAWSYNAGVVYTPVKGQEIYASFSQGFELPDVGVQVRNATPAFNFGASNLEPVKTDTFELGWRGTFSNVAANLTVFHSKSDLGALQSFNNGLTLLRTKERIYGIEGGLDYFSDDNQWALGGTFTWMKGEEKPEGQDSYQNMTGYRIPPLKLTAYVEYTPSEKWSHRIQATYFASKDYRLDEKTSFGRWETSGYTTVDLISRWTIDDKNKVTFGVQNLLNRHYYPLYSQLMRNSNNTSRLPAAGAVLNVSYTHRW
ncbi:TonB-dependent siderophore receptor [Advenella mimigardefordensis]|uniref:TonB-dependent siderophore receptor n=1 Tax=Advenella mimigardefordensis (strain DSM 17166 / LMG 22922 / DPN7) TaxID=1247726 RepID=W0PC01_ADVMD|nr:TonB-dependent receptor [Advenella mimigardefordensis]AHG64231.1 TonB-dependent siderophore receptor [Advenella mimigardefordensis DPN7]